MERSFRDKKISIDDNFFEIGGDSLKAVSLISKMKKIENIPTGISIQLLFTFPSIRKFAQEIKNMNEDLEIATI